MSTKFLRVFVVFTFIMALLAIVLMISQPNYVEYPFSGVIKVYSYPDLHGSCVYPVQKWHDPLWQSICLNSQNSEDSITINGVINNHTDPVHVNSSHGDKTIFIVSPTQTKEVIHGDPFDENTDIILTPMPTPVCQNNPHC